MQSPKKQKEPILENVGSLFKTKLQMETIIPMLESASNQMKREMNSLRHEGMHQCIQQHFVNEIYMPINRDLRKINELYVFYEIILRYDRRN